jgi:hypothetical protein
MELLKSESWPGTRLRHHLPLLLRQEALQLVTRAVRSLQDLVLFLRSARRLHLRLVLALSQLGLTHHRLRLPEELLILQLFESWVADPSNARNGIHSKLKSISDTRLGRIELRSSQGSEAIPRQTFPFYKQQLAMGCCCSMYDVRVRPRREEPHSLVSLYQNIELISSKLLYLRTDVKSTT